MFQLNWPFLLCLHRSTGRLRSHITRTYLQMTHQTRRSLLLTTPPHHSNLEPPSVHTKTMRRLGRLGSPPPLPDCPAIPRRARTWPQWMRPSSWWWGAWHKTRTFGTASSKSLMFRWIPGRLSVCGSRLRQWPFPSLQDTGHPATPHSFRWVIMFNNFFPWC